MYLDGDQNNPTINGTGTEDYVGTGGTEGPFADQYQGCLVADQKNRQYAFYRFHIPDAICISMHNFRATLQQIGGWYAADIKALQTKGVPLKPVSLSGNKGVSAAFLKKTPNRMPWRNADKDDWENFCRTDDYAVTAYYYLEKP